MGHLSNPLSLRLGLNIFWNSIWSSSLIKNKSYFFIEDILFYNLINWYFKKIRKFGYILSHFKFYRKNNNLSLLFFIYNLSVEFKYEINKIIFTKNLNLKKKIYKIIKLNNLFFNSNKFIKIIKKRKKYIIKKNNWFLYLTYIFFFSFNSNNLFFNQYLIKKILLWKFFNLKNKLFNFIIFNKLNLPYNLNFKYYQIYSGEFTSSLLVNYMIIKLSQRFRLFEVVNPLIRALLSSDYLIGFKILCAGRFTRKQIATYYWEKKGKVSLNTFKTFIDYNFSTVTLKNSLCGIKVWLNYSMNYIKIKEQKEKLYFYNIF